MVSVGKKSQSRLVIGTSAVGDRGWRGVGALAGSELGTQPSPGSSDVKTASDDRLSD